MREKEDGMRKMLAIAVVLIFSAVSVAGAADCGNCVKTNSRPVCGGCSKASPCKTEQLIGGMGKKFVRGVTNVFTGWIEIPAQISKGYKKACFGGACVGVCTGVWHFIGRTFSGFYDMAGFWAADPESNDGIGIPLDAEYAWEDGTHYSLTDPAFGAATVTPMGNKFARGLGNACFSFLELPGQFMKGWRAGSCDLGIGKGLWYWASREMDGVYDVATAIFPNPKDTMGMKYDEKWPWTAIGLFD